MGVTALNTWTQKANFPGQPRMDAAAFSICVKGYLGIGGEFPYYNDFWQFDPVLNQWIQKTNFGGLGRDDAAYFSIGNKGYIGLGEYNNATNYIDFWEYTPDSTCITGIEELSSASGGLEFTISPNLAKEFIVISYPLAGKENLDVTITDVRGKKVYETKLFAKANPSFGGLTSVFRFPASKKEFTLLNYQVANKKQ